MVKHLFGFALMLAMTTAHGAYLYWQVGSGANTQDYTDARLLYAAEGSSNFKVLDAVTKSSLTEAGTVATDLSTLGSSTGYAFMIELANYDQATGTTTGVGTSEIMTYAQLADTAIDTGNSLSASMAAMRAWTGGTYVAPEPTTALLMVVGIAFLGLKRKTA